MTRRKSRPLHEAAWPDMFQNLQTAYAELTGVQFELDRRSAEIDEARGLFERVIQSMSEALFLLDTSGRVIQTNRAASALLLLGEEEIVGRPLAELCGTDAIPATPWQVLERSADGTLPSFDLELRLPRGRAVPVNVSGRVARDHRAKITGILIVLRDITERKRGEDALRFLAAASALLARSLDVKTLLGDLAHFIVPARADWCSIELLREDGRIEHCAAAHVDPGREPLIDELRRRFPLSPDARIGYGRVVRTGQSILVAAVTDGDLSSVSADPEYRRLIAALGLTSHVCVPLLSHGRPIGAVTLNLAGTDRRYSQADVEVAEDLAWRAAGAVENAKLYRAAQDANRLKDEFLATLSHELRTPLNAILGWVRLLRIQSPAGPQLDRGLEVIERNASAQHQLIEDLLDLSGIVAGKVRFEPQVVDLGRVVETALDGVRLAAEAKGVSLRLRLDPTEARVPGDPDRLRQVVSNLLSNAIKFTPPQGVVDVSMTERRAHLQIAIADTGKGISREFLPHVFDRFQQQDASTTRTHGGLGLGLAIVKSLVEMHGGLVFAESEGEGKGARFVIRLPIARAPLPAASPPSLHADAVAWDFRGARVLIVEDEQDAREVLLTLFERWGASVTAVATAAGALEAIAREPPDLLVSDIGLPGEDGCALLRRVRALPPDQGGSVPAIALTAYASDDDRRRAEREGFVRHLAKPFEPRDLAAAAWALLKSRA